MRRYTLSILIILLLITSITSLTYAWFTYVEKKSLASFEAGVLSISMYADQMTLSENIEIGDLAFIDYNNDFLNNQDDALNLMASSHRIDIVLNDESPLARAFISFDETELEDGLIYIIIYEGLNIGGSTPLTSDYTTIVSSIISGLSTKAEQIAAINAYNESVLADISNQEFGVSDQLTFQLVAWGDYDAVVDPNIYLDMVFNINMTVTLINSKGVTP